MNLPTLLIPLAVLAIVAWLGWIGHRQAAVPVRHFPGGRARQAEAAELDSITAWLDAVRDGEPPALAQQTIVAALNPAIPCWKPMPPASGPVPPAMQDDDSERPWEYATGQFPKIIDAMGRP